MRGENGMSKLDTLLLYQQTEQKKQDLEQTLRSTPARQKYNRLYTQLKNQQVTNQKLSDDIAEKSARLAKYKELIGKLKDRIDLESGELETIKNDEESTGEEMTELRKDIEKLSKEIAQVVREVKRIQAEVEKTKDEYQKTNLVARNAKKEFDQIRLTVEKERADSADAIKAIDAELAEIEKGIDPELFKKYKKGRQHYTVPVVPVIGGKCSGCNMSLPMVMLKKLNSRDAVLECENCGRILYSNDL